MNNQEVSKYVFDGGKLPQVKGCPNDAYNIMMQCWHSDPEQRPSFSMVIWLVAVLLMTS